MISLETTENVSPNSHHCLFISLKRQEPSSSAEAAHNLPKVLPQTSNCLRVSAQNQLTGFWVFLNFQLVNKLSHMLLLWDSVMTAMHPVKALEMSASLSGVTQCR